MPKYSKTEVAEAIERLKTWVKPGDTVYCILRHRAASGMSRTIALITFDATDKGRPSWIGYSAAIAMGMRYHKEREGIVIGGYGMDMGFALVDDLSRTLGYVGEQRLKHTWL